MRVCPSCGNSYPDDANFCPMDATRLPQPVAEAPATIPSMAVTSPAVTQPDQPAPVGGRFVLSGVAMRTPTGLAQSATDTQTGATVAVKMVAAEVLPTTAMADRALRELKQLGKVTSDRIVRVLDQGKLADGRLYVATEQVDGAATLEELVGREGPLPLDRARAIVLQVGEALTEAQKVGVIHRDVAPRNIFVGPGDRVKVGDFGLAEAISERVFGAPAYLSPEQAEGKPVDQRSNIYSLGAVYYFALTGKAPFAGDTQSLMQQHLSAVPQPPSSLRPGLGADVDRVILKALEKSGGRRHLTLRQLLTEVTATSTAMGAAQPMRAGAEAKTVMGLEAPQMVAPKPQAVPQPPTVPNRVQPTPQPSPPPPSSTILGMPPSSPVGAMGPGSTAPSMPVAPPHVAPHAPTMMAEAPRPAPHAEPAPRPEPPPRAEPPPRSEPPPRAEPAAPAAPMPTPMPHAAPQAPTMMAEAPRVPANGPSPVAAAPLSAKANNQTGKKGAFRETAWFKRGEIEEEMAKAQAAAGDNAMKTGTTGKHLPVDESQVDLSSQDRQRLSLKTGSTQAMPVIKAPVQALPGERMDEAEMLAELNPSKKYLLIAGAVVLAIVIGLVIFFATRSSPKAEAPVPDKPAPVAAAPPATAPAPIPPPSAVAATPTPPATKPPTPEKPAAPAPSPSLYAAQVAKVESAGASAKELKRLTKLITIEEKTAHKKKERELEAVDRELLAKLKKLRGR